MSVPAEVLSARTIHPLVSVFRDQVVVLSEAHTRLTGGASPAEWAVEKRGDVTRPYPSEIARTLRQTFADLDKHLDIGDLEPVIEAAQKFGSHSSSPVKSRIGDGGVTLTNIQKAIIFRAAIMRHQAAVHKELSIAAVNEFEDAITFISHPREPLALSAYGSIILRAGSNPIRSCSAEYLGLVGSPKSPDNPFTNIDALLRAGDDASLTQAVLVLREAQSLALDDIARLADLEDWHPLRELEPELADEINTAEHGYLPPQYRLDESGPQELSFG